MLRKTGIILLIILILFIEYLPAQTLYMLSSTSGANRMKVTASTHLVVSNGGNSELQNNSSSVITVNSSGYIDLDGDFKNNGTATIDNDGTITVDGDWTNNTSGNVFTNVSVGSAGTVEFSKVGTSQEVGGTNWTDFENVTVNHSTGETDGVKMTVTNNRINGTLTLTDGGLSLNSKTLIINNPALGSINSTLGYIVSETLDGDPNPCNSRLQWNIGESIGAYLIPFGTNGATYNVPILVDVTLAGTGSSGYIEAAIYPTADDNTPFPSFPLTVTSMTPDVSYVVDRFYLLDFNDYTANPTATLTLGIDPVDLNGNSPIGFPNIVAQSSEDGSNWSAVTGVYQATPVPGFFPKTSDAVTTITDVTKSLVWVLVDQTHPLPITLLTFKANCDNDTQGFRRVNLLWETATETNNDFFSIEKSDEAKNWDLLATVDGAGNSNDVISYSYTDENPNTDAAYYRLKQTDFDGKYSYSSPISAYCFTSENNIEITDMYITSENSLLISFSSDKGGLHHFNLYDDRGSLITDQNITTDAGKNVLTYNLNNLSGGLYMLTIYNSSKSIIRKLLIQN